jgi:hypothetical protein
LCFAIDVVIPKGAARSMNEQKPHEVVALSAKYGVVFLPPAG